MSAETIDLRESYTERKIEAAIVDLFFLKCSLLGCHTNPVTSTLSESLTGNKYTLYSITVLCVTLLGESLLICIDSSLHQFNLKCVKVKEKRKNKTLYYAFSP